MNNEHTVIRGTKAFTVYHNESGYSNVYTQPVNAKTGKPWQARRYVATFQGEDHKAKAALLWLRMLNAAQKGGGK